MACLKDGKMSPAQKRVPKQSCTDRHMWISTKVMLQGGARKNGHFNKRCHVPLDFSVEKMTCDLSLHNTQRMFRDFEDPNSKGKNNKTFMIKLGRKYS